MKTNNEKVSDGEAVRCTKLLAGIRHGAVWVNTAMDGWEIAQKLEAVGLRVVRFTILSGNECASCTRPKIVITPNDAPLYELSAESVQTALGLPPLPREKEAENQPR